MQIPGLTIENAPINENPETQQSGSVDFGSQVQTPQVSQTQGIPQYLTQDQTRQLLQAAQQKGIDPGQALKALTDQGHIVQGVNDQNYIPPTSSQSDQSSSEGGNIITNSIKSLTQPFVAGAGTAIRSLQSIPQLLRGDISGAEQTQATPIFGQKTIPGMNTEEAIGTGLKAASFLAPELGLGTTATGALGGAAFGAGEAMNQNKSAGGVVGESVLGAAGGALLGKILPKIAPMLFRGEQTSEDAALNAYQSGFKSLGDYQNAFKQEFVNGAKAIDENISSKISLSVPELQDLQATAKTFGVKLPKELSTDLTLHFGKQELGGNLTNIPGAELSASDTQKVLTELGKKSSINGTTNSQINDLIDTLHTKATETFGEPFDKLYENYANSSEALKSINDIFGKPNTTQTASKISSNMKRISDLMNNKQGKTILLNTLNDFKNISGLDLTNKSQAIAAVNKITHPALKAAGKLLLNGLGLLTEGTVIGKSMNLFK